MGGLIYEWSGDTTSSGQIGKSGPRPSLYTLSYSGGDKRGDVRISFFGGAVSGVSTSPNKRPNPKNIPVTREHKCSSSARRTCGEFFPLMRRITIKCARTWHYRKMRPRIEPSNDLALSSPFRSWLDCTTNTSGYDFRKGQACVRRPDQRIPSRQNMLSPHYRPAHCAVQHNIPYKAHTQHPAQRIREVH